MIAAPVILRHLRHAGLALALGLSVAPGAAMASEACTSDTITLVVPYAPGGVVDLVGRVVADELRTSVGQNVIVENKAGAGSNIGTAAVARAAPDGRTLVLASAAHTINPSLYKKQTFDAIKDFAPVGMVGSVPNLIVVNPEVPVNSMAELIAYAKANPGKINFGSAGTGSSPHLAMEMLKAKTGIDMQHVPYQGQPQATQDLVTNRIQAMALTMTLAVPLVKDGKLKALAVTSDKRSDALPDVPTVAETVVPGFNVVTYLAVLAPAGTPEKTIKCLNAALVSGLAKPGVIERMKPLSAVVASSTPQELAAFMVKDRDQWAEVIKAAGITVQ
ncbi:Bug family tripartite tricarboxylate transporter substrate binding protein [Xanthobacter pseudotagetidis]|uniref:Bug family tripartite tricarboxylate transporter substrate binding protein n=1 Tax=Xanthobacter pseudotagetidis TaxID=3119911 RepID=UPI00372A83D8